MVNFSSKTKLKSDTRILKAAEEYLSLGKIRYRGIFKHLLQSFLLIGTLPVIVVCLVLFSSVEREITNSVQLAQNQLKSQYLSNLEYRLAAYKESVSRIAKNTVIQRVLSDNQQLNPIADGALITEEVNKTLYIGEYSDIINCMIYSDNHQHELYGKNITMLKLNPGLKASGLLQNSLSSLFESSQLGRSVLKLYAPIANLQSVGQNIAWIELSLSVNHLFSPNVDEKFKAHAFSVIIVDQNENIVFSSGDEPEIGNVRLEEIGGLLQNVEQVQEGQWIYSREKLPKDGLTVYFLFQNRELINRQKTFLSLVTSIILVLLAAVLIVSLLITRSFTSRVRHIARKMDEAGRGNFVLDQPVSGKDEIRYLDEQLGLMFIRLDELMKEIVEKDIQKREAQIESLQFQINPHFLYNTLETISSLASIQRVDAICDICHKLGDIFRYSLGKDYDNLVSLEQELSFVQNYFDIQKLRFGQQLDVFYDVEADAMEALVPRFILQPIIENAISHGLKPKNGKGVIEISAQKLPQNILEIKIEDDGIGMQAKEIAWLNRILAQDRGEPGEGKSGIGICNVHHRIRLMYGEAFGLHFASQAGMGTRFYIRIPWLTKQEELNQVEPKIEKEGNALC